LDSSGIGNDRGLKIRADGMSRRLVSSTGSSISGSFCTSQMLSDLAFFLAGRVCGARGNELSALRRSGGGVAGTEVINGCRSIGCAPPDSGGLARRPGTRLSVFLRCRDHSTARARPPGIWWWPRRSALISCRQLGWSLGGGRGWYNWLQDLFRRWRGACMAWPGTGGACVAWLAIAPPERGEVAIGEGMRRAVGSGCRPGTGAGCSQLVDDERIRHWRPRTIAAPGVVSGRQVRLGYSGNLGAPEFATLLAARMLLRGRMTSFPVHRGGARCTVCAPRRAARIASLLFRPYSRERLSESLTVRMCILCPAPEMEGLMSRASSMGSPRRGGRSFLSGARR